MICGLLAKAKWLLHDQIHVLELLRKKNYLLLFKPLLLRLIVINLTGWPISGLFELKSGNNSKTETMPSFSEKCRKN